MATPFATAAGHDAVGHRRLQPGAQPRRQLLVVARCDRHARDQQRAHQHRARRSAPRRPIASGAERRAHRTDDHPPGRLGYRQRRHAQRMGNRPRPQSRFTCATPIASSTSTTTATSISWNTSTKPASFPRRRPSCSTAARTIATPQITNWKTNDGGITAGSNWQPSRFDEVQINGGTVVVDAAGQHAGVLKVGANAGQPATLNITGGWLRVADRIGHRRTPRAKGQFNLTGGVLESPSSAGPVRHIQFHRRHAARRRRELRLGEQRRHDRARQQHQQYTSGRRPDA